MIPALLAAVTAVAVLAGAVITGVYVRETPPDTGPDYGDVCSALHAELDARYERVMRQAALERLAIALERVHRRRMGL